MRVLVIEDSPVTALATEDALADLGHFVVGPTGRFSEAVDLIDAGGFDAALVDINVRGTKAFPLMARLAHAGKPFIVMTGYASWDMPEEWRDRPRLAKPFNVEQLKKALDGIGD